MSLTTTSCPITTEALLNQVRSRLGDILPASPNASRLYFHSRHTHVSQNKESQSSGLGTIDNSRRKIAACMKPHLIGGYTRAQKRRQTWESRT